MLQTAAFAFAALASLGAIIVVGRWIAKRLRQPVVRTRSHSFNAIGPQQLTVEQFARLAYRPPALPQPAATRAPLLPYRPS